MNAKLLLDSTVKDLKNYSGKWTWFIVGEHTLHFFVRLPNQYRGKKKLDFLHNSTDFDCIMIYERIMWSEMASKLLTWHKQEEKELGIGVQQLTVILRNVRLIETCYDGLETMNIEHHWTAQV